MGERLYAGDEFNRGDGIVYVIGIALKFMACVCIFGMMVGKYTLPNILRSRLAVSVFAVALICVVVMLLEKMKCDKLNRFFSYAGTLSLELYISHIAICAIARLLEFPIYNIFFYCCCMATSVILSILLKEVSCSLQNYLMAEASKTDCLSLWKGIDMVYCYLIIMVFILFLTFL